MEIINTKVGYATFAFKDEEGAVFASFKINPTDPRLMERCKNIAKFFSDCAAGKVEGANDAAAFEKMVEDKFCTFLGYDCRESLFGRVAATDVMADGRTFANHILDTMIQKIGPEIAARRRANIARYTAKYK